MKIYRKEGVTAERPHLNLPKGSFEEEIGLEGFYGPVSHLYHRHPPTSWSKISRSSFQWPRAIEISQEFLKPLCFSKGESSGDFFKSHRLLFWNDDLRISILKMTEESKMYFRNADCSELYFCHEGKGRLESAFGSLDFESGDYLAVPKGVTYRFSHIEKPYLLKISSHTNFFQKPPTGILGQQALYHEENCHSPKLEKIAEEKSSTVLIQKDGLLTEVEYAFDLRAIVGWFGTLYPFKLSVKQMAPVMSPMAHLPPSVNSTFLCKGFVVCTFLPRPLEEPEGALKVPFFHSNIDYDEVIFYHEGDFFSRDNMSRGCLTLHPRGINHGPHPKAIANQGKKTRTDEIAVMVDTEKTLKISEFAAGVEQKNYWQSWITK